MVSQMELVASVIDLDNTFPPCSAAHMSKTNIEAFPAVAGVTLEVTSAASISLGVIA